MTKKKELHKDTYYHIYNRGALKAPVFYEEGDFQFFLYRMRDYSKRTHISILAYCLMANHFHIFVKQNTDEFKVSKFIALLTNSFTKFINTKYSGRAGVVFQGPTKCKPVLEDGHMIWITKYIIDNPKNAGLVTRPEEWKFSSAMEYLGSADLKICDINKLIDLYSTKEAFDEIIWNEASDFSEYFFSKW